MPEPELSPKMSELEALLNSKESAAVLDAILGNTPSGAAIVSVPDGKILRASNYAAQLLGLPRSAVEGRTAREALANYDASGRPLPYEEWPLARALNGETVTGAEAWLPGPNGERIPCLANAAPIRNARGDVIGAISSFADLRPYKALERSLREALAQREALYRELTHRVKNHLQIMTALVAHDAQNPALSAKELGDQMKGQLQTMAAVYRGMDRAGVGEPIQARTLIDEVSRPYASHTVSVDVAVAPPDLTLPSDRAGPLGMLVNEAVCNSYKHAFDGQSGRIQVSLRRLEPGRLRLEVADDGRGWRPAKPGHGSHGLELMRTFAEQLHGELELGDRPQGGALVAAELPEAA
jgi:PAS domain S-box-containing protein